MILYGDVVIDASKITFSPLFYGVFNDTATGKVGGAMTKSFSPLFYGVFNDTLRRGRMGSAPILFQSPILRGVQ